MIDWSTTLNTVVSLIAGGGIAMAGKALADRRAHRREIEADQRTRHREIEADRRKFMIDNFSFQREALVNVKDSIMNISSDLQADASKRRQVVAHKKWQEMITTLGEYSSDPDVMDRAVESGELVQFLESGMKFMSGQTALIRERGKLLQKIAPHIDDVRSNMLLAASGAVVEAVEAYLKIAGEYFLITEPIDQMQLIRDELDARKHVLAAIGKVLKEGPFSGDPSV